MPWERAPRSLQRPLPAATPCPRLLPRAQRRAAASPERTGEVWCVWPGSEADAASIFRQNRLSNRGADAVHGHEVHFR